MHEAVLVLFQEIYMKKTNLSLLFNYSIFLNCRLLKYILSFRTNYLFAGCSYSTLKGHEQHNREGGSGNSSRWKVSMFIFKKYFARTMQYTFIVNLFEYKDK